MSLSSWQRGVIACALFAFDGCSGPGLEPPFSQDTSSPMMGGSAAGAGAGMLPTAGASGTAAGGEGGAAGMMEAPVAGTGAGAAGQDMTAGIGGTGAAGMGGAAGEAGMGGAAGTQAGDAGEPAFAAPPQVCETSREVVELSAAALSGLLPRCEVTMPAGAVEHAPDALLLTVTELDAGAPSTRMPKQVSDLLACSGDDAFFYVHDLLSGTPVTLVMCAELCEVIRSRDPATVAIELIYGCPPPR